MKLNYLIILIALHLSGCVKAERPGYSVNDPDTFKFMILLNLPCGDTCRIFLTSFAYTGNLGGVAGADEKCNADPFKPVGGYYKAMLVDDGTSRTACIASDCPSGISEHKDWVLKPDTKYIRPDGTPIFTSNAFGIFSFLGFFTNPIVPYADSAWTGLSTAWMYNSSSCTNWTYELNAFSAPAGSANVTTGGVLNFSNPMCDQKVKLYCVEQ